MADEEADFIETFKKIVGEIQRRGIVSLSEWRAENPNIYDEITGKWSNPIDFSGDKLAKIFEGQEAISFTGWDFGGGANFSGANFEGKEISFVSCIFGENLDLENITFGEAISFRTCSFCGETSFVNARIKNLEIERCTFNIGNNSSGVLFERCKFSGTKTAFIADRFERTQFFTEILFKDCEFEANTTDLTRTIFHKGVEFYNCNFLHLTNFVGTEFGTESMFQECRFLGDVNITGSSKSRLPQILLCQFFSNLDYSDRSLASDFSGTTFHELPDFSANDFGIDRLNLTDVKFKIVNAKRRKFLFFDFITEGSILLKLRALRGVAEKTKNHDLERDLYIEERKAERGIYANEFWKKVWRGRAISRIYYAAKLLGHCLMITIMWLYWISSNYGRSIIWPVFWYFAFLFSFIWSYGKIFYDTAFAGIKNGMLANQADFEKYDTLATTLAVANNIPIVGNLSLDNEMKQFVFCGGHVTENASVCIPPDGYMGMLIAQNLIAGILIFLFGLGLRNYFKIK